jgi:hypothetical protein
MSKFFYKFKFVRAKIGGIWVRHNYVGWRPTAANLKDIPILWAHNDVEIYAKNPI